MTKGIHRLTALGVNKLTKPGLYSDGGGLYLQITPTGVKSWLYRFYADHKAHGMGLGPLHTVGLSDARVLATQARRLRIEGHNPLTVKRQQAQALKTAKARIMTFDECADAYIKAHKAGWKNEKHQDQWRNSLKTYASPFFGKLPVDQVDTALVVRCLSKIWETKTETASRVRGRIESILGWATTSGHRSGENPARWRGHLENLLANASKVSCVRNHPSLPWQEVPAFMAALRSAGGDSARALEFTILTACRSGEVRGAQWKEIDFDQQIWTVPSSRMKAGIEHEVPLSPSAIRLLRSMQEQQAASRKLGVIEGDLVFMGTKGRQLSDMSLIAVVRRMNDSDSPTWKDTAGQPITVHGFRSSFRMWAAEATNYDRATAEHALAHQLPDAVERAYQRGTQFKKRVALMKDWSDLCEGKTTKPQQKTGME